MEALAESQEMMKVLEEKVTSLGFLMSASGALNRYLAVMHCVIAIHRLIRRWWQTQVLQPSKARQPNKDPLSSPFSLLAGVCGAACVHLRATQFVHRALPVGQPGAVR